MVKQRLILNTLLSWQYALLGVIWLGENRKKREMKEV